MKTAPTRILSKTMALAISSTLIFGAASLQAAESPFAFKALSSGYQVADNHVDKAKDGKCGEGKCGADKTSDKTADTKAKDGKCGEGKCGAESKSESTVKPAEEKTVEKASEKAAMTKPTKAEPAADNNEIEPQAVATKKPVAKKVMAKKTSAKKRMMKKTTTKKRAVTTS